MDSYIKGKMSGFGMMQTGDGWEYIGFWKEDELHGECVCWYVFNIVDSKKQVCICEHEVCVPNRVLELYVPS